MEVWGVAEPSSREAWTSDWPASGSFTWPGFVGSLWGRLLPCELGLTSVVQHIASGG